MGLFCEIFGHRFEQPVNAEAIRSSDGALMVHGWVCRSCRATTQTFEPMDAFIQRIADWARGSGGTSMPPPIWLGPPKPGRFSAGRQIAFAGTDATKR
jgi:hypothetical protein